MVLFGTANLAFQEKVTSDYDSSDLVFWNSTKILLLQLWIDWIDFFLPVKCFSACVAYL